MEDINYAMSDVQEQLSTETQDTSPSVGGTEQTGQPVQTQETQTQDTPSTYNIDGVGDVTPEQIKEWKQGYMRQSDYTKKTQELARQRREFEETRNIPQQIPRPIPQQVPYPNQFGYDPRINQALDRVTQLEQEVSDRQLEQEVTRLKEKYPDFDEVKVLNEALSRNIPDIEFVYKAMRDDDVSRETIRQEVINELAKTRQGTSTMISSETNRQPSPVTLSQSESRIAQAMGLTPEEYAKWR